MRTGREMFGAGRELADYRAAELYIVRLERDRDRISEELARAELEREEARLAYVERHKAREAIEKLKERRQAEYYRLAEREETKALDDLVKGRNDMIGLNVVNDLARPKAVRAKE